MCEKVYMHMHVGVNGLPCVSIYNMSCEYLKHEEWVCKDSHRECSNRSL